VKWYLAALKKYAIFNGRSRRTEYWMFALINFLILLLLGAVELQTGIIGLSGVYALGVLIPGVAVTVRRLHDTNRSAWWLLILLVPGLGALILLVFMLLEGGRARNRFGPDPKRIGAELA
jgi:uncharacterized membrane protein YhaH (DUF805 family)